MHAVSPAYRAGSPKVRSLVNHLTNQLSDAGYTDLAQLPARLLISGRAELFAGKARGRPGRGSRRGGARPARRPGRRRRGRVPDRGAAPAGRAARRFEEADPRAAAGGLRWRCALSGRAEIGVGAASVAEIERLNILRAALLAMCRAVARLPVAARSGAGRRQPAAAAALRRAMRGRWRRACRCRSPPPRSSPRCCATGRWRGWRCGSPTTAGTAMSAMRPSSIVAALRRLGPTRHHRPSFGTRRAN